MAENVVVCDLRAEDGPRQGPDHAWRFRFVIACTFLRSSDFGLLACVYIVASERAPGGR